MKQNHPCEQRRYTLKEQIKWHLTGFAIIVAGLVVIGFVVLCAIQIVMP